MKKLAIPFALLLLSACTQMLDQKGKETLDQLHATTLTDVDQAYAWAFLNRDEPAMQCLSAIRVVVVQAHSMTEIGPITLVQMGMDITSPTGYLNSQCAAQRAVMKARVQLFIGSTATLLAAFGL